MRAYEQEEESLMKKSIVIKFGLLLLVISGNMMSMQNRLDAIRIFKKLHMTKNYHTSSMLRNLDNKLNNERNEKGSGATDHTFVLFDKDGKVGIIRLNHPPVNSLSEEVMQSLDLILKKCEEDPDIHCMVLTGSKKIFSGGADIKEMHNKSYMDAYKGNFLSKGWDTMSKLRKPIVAAVSGSALGGGCELAERCHIIIAGTGAQI